ncbi:MAG: phosphoribosylanthranilate isomerase [Anaerolineales bacterium]|nr:phosphoribosylanthranilate isomerase [Anaerolineales bacterium]
MTKVKICGITTITDAEMAANAGADMLGFVFYPPSTRYLPPVQAAEITNRIRDLLGGDVPKLVGVFVDVHPDDISCTSQLCQLDYVQLHGSETAAEVGTLIELGLRVIKAFRVRDRASLSQIDDFRAEAVLLDAYSPNNPGGTGQSFDWSLAEQIQAQRPIILAGGLTPTNIARAIDRVHPWAVDVSSGVEASPGIKDDQAVNRFIQAVRNNDGGNV